MVNLKIFIALPIFALLSWGATCATVSSSMIVEMRDITSVSMSPDGAVAVVGVCRPDVKANGRDLSWVIVDLERNEAIREITAGPPIFDPQAPGGLLNQNVQWSRDSGWFFFLRRRGSEVQLWRARKDGVVTEQMTHSDSDIVGLSGSSDPNFLKLELSPTRKLMHDAQDAENRQGILYDDHVLGQFPLINTFPFIDRWRNIRRADNGRWVPPGWTGVTPAVFDIRGRTIETQSSPASVEAENHSDSMEFRTTIIPTEKIPDDPYDYAGQYTLRVESKEPPYKITTCDATDCTANRITILGWSDDQQELFYVADSLQGLPGTRIPGHALIYGWRPRENVLRLICDPQGRLYNLDSPTGPSIVSARVTHNNAVLATVGPDQPPRVVSIDLASGRSRTVFDPNARLRRLTKGLAQRISWPTSSGYVGQGFRILPDGYQPGIRYPMVVTTYTCEGGFLQGGSSDNVSEFVAAHQGFVAVCVDLPVREILAREGDFSKTYPVLCNLLSTLIDDQGKKGVVDESRVGLSGHSLGANAGAYCIAHPNRIAAAAFRNGSVLERVMWDLIDTAAWRRDPVNGSYAKFNMPNPHIDPTGRWAEMSVADKADKINTPTLLQVSDTEFLSALPLWSAMRDAGKVIEMHVFPRETHRLIQPIHQWMNFERQLDWFKFWLKNEEDSDPVKRDQYLRWRKLRELSKAGRGEIR